MSLCAHGNPTGTIYSVAKICFFIHKLLIIFITLLRSPKLFVFLHASKKTSLPPLYNLWHLEE